MKLIFSLFVFLSFSNIVMAGTEFYLNGGSLGPFPAAGSADEKKDVETLLYHQKNRTAKDCQAAEQEANASLKVFFGGKQGLLSEKEVSAAEKKLRLLTMKTGTQIFYYKSKYKRPRPYLTHSEIKPCIDLESSRSYPSGHATLGRVYARALSVMFPERKLLIMKRGDEVAMNRVIGGVHYPSDVEAGKKLGDAIAEDYLNTDGNSYKLERQNN